MKTTSLSDAETVNARKMSVYWPTLLLLNGINAYPGRGNTANVVELVSTVYPWLISTFWMFILVSVSMSLVYRSTGYEDTVEMLTYITGSLSTLIMFTIGMRKRPNLNRMLEIMRHEFWYENTRRISSVDAADGYGNDRRPTAKELFALFLRTYGAVFPVATMTMGLTPVFWVTKSNDINSPAALIFRMWTPWQQLTLTKYVVAYIIQFIVSVSVLVSINGMVLAMVIFVNEMQFQVDILVDTVRGLDVDSAYSGLRPDAARARESRDDLIRCVKHHQTLIAYFNNFKSYFNLLFIVDIMYILVMTCLCASSVLITKGFSAFHIKMISLLTIVLAQFFFYCLIGEIFSRMNRQIGDCFYFKLVQCKCPELTRIGVLVVLRTQKPLQLSAAGITKYTASLLTFTTTMKSAYAGLNVLYNSSK